MGIKGLSKLLQEMTDGSGIKANEIKSYFGRKIAIDASMALYQFLIAVRQSTGDGSFQQLTNEEGHVTSHLIGMMYRSIRMMENGIKPVFVFDGKPPDFKSHELEKRKEARQKARDELKEAEKADDTAKVAQMQRRLVRVDKTHVAESQRLLDCLGIPWIAAPSEAEAQCAVLVKKGLVFGTATEDMDALTFGTPILLRQLTYSEARKMPVLEFKLEKLLADLGVTMDQFIDICILCGCDYIPSIRGIGPKTAYRLIKEHGDMETLLAKLDRGKYTVPEGFLFEQARALFKKPDVTEGDAELAARLKWRDCDREALVQFLVKEKGFSLDRVESAMRRLAKCKGKGSQRRVDSFFSFQGVSTSSTKQAKNAQKLADLKRGAKKKGRKTPAKGRGTKGKKAGATKAGPYANLNLNKDKTKTKDGTAKAKKSAKKTAKKSAKKSTKKTKKSTKKSGKKSVKKKSTKKSKTTDNKIIGKKRKLEDLDIDMETTNTQNESQNGNTKETEANMETNEKPNETTLPDINSVSLDTNANNTSTDGGTHNADTSSNGNKENTTVGIETESDTGNKNGDNETKIDTADTNAGTDTNKENNASSDNCTNATQTESTEAKSDSETQTPLKATNVVNRLNKVQVNDDGEEDDSDSVQLAGFDVDEDSIGKGKETETEKSKETAIADTDEKMQDSVGNGEPPRKKQRMMMQT